MYINDATRQCYEGSEEDAVRVLSENKGIGPCHDIDYALKQLCISPKSYEEASLLEKPLILLEDPIVNTSGYFRSIGFANITSSKISTSGSVKVDPESRFDGLLKQMLDMPWAWSTNKQPIVVIPILGDTPNDLDRENATLAKDAMERVFGKNKAPIFFARFNSSGGLIEMTTIDRSDGVRVGQRRGEIDVKFVPSQVKKLIMRNLK